MPLQQWILVNIPTWVIGTVMFAVAVLTSVGGVLLVRRYAHVGDFKRHHDVASSIFSTLGVVYAVMLGFVLIVVWQNFDKAKDNVVRESNYYADIYRDIIGLPEPLASQAKESLTKYIDAVIEDEWPLLALGERSLKVQELANQHWALMASFEPVTETQKAFYAEILHRMNDAGEMRRQRLADSTSGIHPVLWFVLLLGGIITIVFTFFFGSENLVAQLIMTTLLAMLIVLILFTILCMDFPFSGDLSIGPQAFQQVLQYLK